ncbi:indolepyruvate ferredoxin oxidoreductase subunit alpha [Anoxynatronum sibiricum]|uniref:Indolepyruvate oxidoreductase subunit IorA n=1 Tax=Anoxynatronum sibiricum TaxID=210623 RepID=A0ABU9VXF9_9CLOT
MSSPQKTLLTGNQAVARGFWEAGGLVAASYPGSPTVEVLESLHQYPEIESAFSTNEKVALEVAIGASLAGVRALASMKHVGVNIAADPLMTFTQTPTRGGFVLISGDDPGMNSSQNEQDNRNFACFANMAVLVPSNSQEAKDYTRMALEISEVYRLPVMVQITSRVCHGRCPVVLGEREEHLGTPFPREVPNYAMIPPNTFDKQYHMKERLEKLAEGPEMEKLMQLEETPNAATLLITSGLPHHNLKELENLNQPVSILKLGMPFPLPQIKLQALAAQYEKVIVVEEMTPFIENQLKVMGIACEGKSLFPFTGELHTETIEAGLKKAGLVTESAYQSTGLKEVNPAESDASKEGDVARQGTVSEEAVGQGIQVPPRPPLFCAGCPHRPVFDILKKSKVMVNNDIGCYSMGLFSPFEASHSLISMGATLGISKGMLKANRQAGRPIPLVSVIGDGTFFHSGMPGMVDLLTGLEPEDNLTILLLDNGTTAMTGGQANAATGKRSEETPRPFVDIPQLLKAMGVRDVQVVDQFRYKEASEAINKAIKTPGLSVIITTRPCALHFRIKNPIYQVDPAICIGCRTCIKTNCPPLRMKAYEGYEKLKSSIDPTMCVGCSICAQVCPVNAISRPVDRKKADDKKDVEKEESR